MKPTLKKENRRAEKEDFPDTGIQKKQTPPPVKVGATSFLSPCGDFYHLSQLTQIHFRSTPETPFQ
jgi:hypothetical protein